MSCRSWWCGGDAEIALGQSPPGARATLPCGCIVVSTGDSGDEVAVTFATVACAAHAVPPAGLPSGTPVRIDLLSGLLEG